MITEEQQQFWKKLTAVRSCETCGNKINGPQSEDGYTYCCNFGSGPFLIQLQKDCPQWSLDGWKKDLGWE